MQKKRQMTSEMWVVAVLIAMLGGCLADIGATRLELHINAPCRSSETVGGAPQGAVDDFPENFTKPSDIAYRRLPGDNATKTWITAVSSRTQHRVLMGKTVEGGGIVKWLSAGPTDEEIAGGDSGKFAGFKDGTRSQARFNNPIGIAIDAANEWVFIADSGNHRIRLWDRGNNSVSTLAGGPDPGSSDGEGSEASFNTPISLALDPAAATTTLYVADAGNDCIRKVEVIRDGENIRALVSRYAGACRGEGTTQAVSDLGISGDLRLDGDSCAECFANGVLLDARFSFPTNVVVIPEKGKIGVSTEKPEGVQLLVVDAGNHVLRLVTTTRVETLLGRPGYVNASNRPDKVQIFEGGAYNDSLHLNSPAGLAFSDDGWFAFSEPYDDRVSRVCQDQVVRVAPKKVDATVADEMTSFSRPAGLAIDTRGSNSGNLDILFVANEGSTNADLLVRAIRVKDH